MTISVSSCPVSMKVDSNPSTSAIMIMKIETVNPIPSAVMSVPTLLTQRLPKLYFKGIFITQPFSKHLHRSAEKLSKREHRRQGCRPLRQSPHRLREFPVSPRRV